MGFYQKLEEGLILNLLTYKKRRNWPPSGEKAEGHLRVLNPKTIEKASNQYGSL